MNEFVIYHYDDVEDSLNTVDTYIIALNDELESEDVKIINHKILENSILADKIKKKEKIDLIILDMFKDGENVGEQILETIKQLRLAIPVIIYTHGSKEKTPVNFSKLREEYPFILCKEIIKHNPKELKEQIKKAINRQFSVSENFGKNLYHLYDEDDVFLQADIRSIGISNLVDILSQIKNRKQLDVTFELYRMFSGYSGAAIFKLKYDTQSVILKISRDKEKLEEEMERARKFYKCFPSFLRIDIGGDENQFSTDEVTAFLIEEVYEGISLENWLKETPISSKIESYFEELYLSANSMKDHYKKNRSRETGYKYNFIFDKLHREKYGLIQKAIQELKPVIDKNITSDFTFEEKDILNFIEHLGFREINSKKLLGEKFQKKLVLCHGDFHANNVMVQGKRPVLIDTGGLNYEYWCMDICRLIVYIFIFSFDKGRYAYFDLDKIKDNLKKAYTVINMEGLEEEEGENKGYVYAINWLLTHVSDIYSDLYSKWEFQLGLCKEFLQASYRVNTLPPNKRVIALFAAHKCLIAANEELIKEKG